MRTRLSSHFLFLFFRRLLVSSMQARTCMLLAAGFSSALTILVSDHRWKRQVFSLASVPVTVAVAAFVAGSILG